MRNNPIPTPLSSVMSWYIFCKCNDVRIDMFSLRSRSERMGTHIVDPQHRHNAYWISVQDSCDCCTCKEQLYPNPGRRHNAHGSECPCVPDDARALTGFPLPFLPTKRKLIFAHKSQAQSRDSESSPAPDVACVATQCPLPFRP